MDKLKVLFALALMIAGVVGFYTLSVEQEGIRIVVIAAAVIAAATVLWFSSHGRRFIEYARGSIKETQKVVWPSRRETWQTTALVFLFVAVLSLFMWLVDSGLSWVMYDLLLGQQ